MRQHSVGFTFNEGPKIENPTAHNDYGEEVVCGTKVPQRGPGAEKESKGMKSIQKLETLLNEHAILNASLMKIVKFVVHI